MKRAVVIGGGPAGMMAAGVAGSRGLEVVLAERNGALGRKLLLTGNGRCNFTNACQMREFVERTFSNGKFLHNAFGAFSNTALVSFLEMYGVSSCVEPDGRVFPITQKASDVLDALKRFIVESRVNVVCGRAIGLRVVRGAVKAVEFEGGKIIECSSAVVATGGISYPGTGSTGDGHMLALSAGHSVVDFAPGLVPIELGGHVAQVLQGLSMGNARLRAIGADGKEFFSVRGAIVFAHFGVSGPAALAASSAMNRRHPSRCSVSMDFLPDMGKEEMEAAISAEIKANPARSMEKTVARFVPARLAAAICAEAGVDPSKKANQANAPARRRTAELLKGLAFPVKGLRPLEEAMVTSGGVSVKELDPKTMESRIVKGLYFAGEVIDVDADTGGFNLQAAFSTGFVAGMSC